MVLDLGTDTAEPVDYPDVELDVGAPWSPERPIWASSCADPGQG